MTESSILDEIYQSFAELLNPRCPNCDGLDLKEYSGEFICLDCGEWIPNLDDCWSHRYRELYHKPFVKGEKTEPFTVWCERETEKARTNWLVKIARRKCEG